MGGGIRPSPHELATGSSAPPHVLKSFFKPGSKNLLCKLWINEQLLQTATDSFSF
jgi:hypothetical protein